MPNKLPGVAGCCFIVVLLASCAANKKTQQQINELNNNNEQLSKKVSDLNNQVNQLTAQNRQLEAEKKQGEADFTEYKKQCESSVAKYKHASDVLNDQDQIMRQLEKRLGEALADLQDRGLSVYYKRGLVFVSLEDQLLFSSGSSKIDKKGTDALLKIAGVLKDYPNLRIIVVGNTDSVQVKKGDNWSLSTERANSVVRVLRSTYHIDPTRLTAAGKGKFNPVADNSTAEGRAKNRRVDIILNPDMDKVWETIEL